MRLAAAAVVTWQLGGVRRAGAAAPLPGLPSLPPLDLPSQTATLEAFSDTMIPGEKRFAGDRAIAGVVSGPGAVQAGAVAFMEFPPVGLAPALPALAAAITAQAVQYAAQHAIVLDPTVAPWVSLTFAQRTGLAVDILTFSHVDYLPYYALAALPFLAFHTAGHLHTVDAVRHGHPGLASIKFPPPDADGLWRFPTFSYRRQLARTSPRTTASGSPS
jgi:hypothetical protein